MHHRESPISITVTAVTAAATVVFGVASVGFANRLSDNDEARRASEVTEGDATDFVMSYFASTCAERADLMSFPLDQWFNWRHGDTVRTYSRPGSPNLHIPTTDEDPSTAVLGTTQEREELQSYDAARSPRILSAIKEGYRLDVSDPIPATSKDPVVLNCAKGRSEARELVEPEIPVDIRDITPLGADRGVHIVVDAIADLEGRDHVVDKTATYSMRIVERDDGWKLIAIAGLETDANPD